jgi:hypothetical protein
MTTTQTHTRNQTDLAPDRAGPRLATGSALFAAGVALEWVLNPQHGDGSVEHPVRFAICVGTSVLGASLMTWALRSVRPALSHNRRTRFGRSTATVGVAMLLLSAAAVLVTGLVSGSPAGLSFVPWALGMLALTVGPLVLGLGLLRHRRSLAACALVAGLAAFASVAIPLDPWHDVALMTMCGAFVALGFVLGTASSMARAQVVASTRSRQ